MDITKRKLTFDESSAEKTKKLQNKAIQSITSIEKLSDELFCEIFDYLYVNDIYQAFSNLNHRFQQILHASSPLFHLSLHDRTLDGSSVNDDYNRFLLHNKHKIVSAHLRIQLSINKVLQFITIDASYSCLESIYIDANDSDILSLLPHLVYLPRLFVLAIFIDFKCENPDNFFRLIFALPQLKSYRFHYDIGNEITLPIATKEQYSRIEILALYTSYRLNEILTLTSYTPNLRRLIIPNGIDHKINIQTLLPIRLSNLTYLWTRLYTLNFHQFEIFIKKICSTLKILRIEFLEQDANFLQGDYWENLILTSLPHLEELHFIYNENCSRRNEHPYSGRLNPFNSSFWIDRRWFFEVEIKNESIYYIVRPYRKRWYQYGKDEDLYSSIDYSKWTRLTISNFNDIDSDAIISEDIMYILTITTIYHLEIIGTSVYIPSFIRLLSVLTDLKTLKIQSINWNNSKLKYEDFSMGSSTKETSKITKVYIENVNNIRDLFLLLTLCPNMTYLKIDSINVIDQDVKSILAYFIHISDTMPINHVRSLCFRIPAADDRTIKKLKRTIINNGIACDYTIKRIVDYVYIEWKLISNINSS